MRPLPLHRAPLHQVRAVFTDVDGTLTTEGKLSASTLRSLEQLRDAGVRVVLVSGRSSGWGECWARTLPVDGVIVENGGLYFRPVKGGVKKRYLEPDHQRGRNRRRLAEEVRRVVKKVRGARLSMDSAYTEVDLAIDYNESVRLGHRAAAALERHLRARGVRAVRSSVHVNCWLGNFDKAVAVKAFMRQEWKTGLRADDQRFVYVGDSLNDAPMFAAFSLSVGVANVLEVLELIEARPAYVTSEPEGRGFEELARRLLFAIGPSSKSSYRAAPGVKLARAMQGRDVGGANRSLR